MSTFAISILVADSFPAYQVGAAVGITNFAGMTLGATLMPLVGGQVAQHWGIPAALGMVVAASGTAALIGGLWMPRLAGVRGGVRPRTAREALDGHHSL